NYQGSSNIITNFGTINRMTSGTTAVSVEIVFQTSGTVNIQEGTLEVAGSYHQFGGETNLASGASLSSTGGVYIDGGALSGSGTVEGDVHNAGEIMVGASDTAGTLSVVGDFAQTESGILDFELGGTDSGGF